jgi:hypothetical protein
VNVLYTQISRVLSKVYLKRTAKISEIAYFLQRLIIT